VKVFFRQLTVVKIDASFSYIVFFDETFKFTAREDEVSLGVYWFFRNQKEWNGILPTTGSGSSNATPCPTFNFVALHNSGFQDSQ